MKRYTYYIYIGCLTALLLSSCMKQVENPTVVQELPDIYPDYIDVTIPVGIAPMDFNMTDDEVELIDVVARGGKGGELHAQGAYADFDIDEWHALTAQNQGTDIRFTVSALKKDEWIQYQDFTMHVSPCPLTDFGITYRRIAPGYEVGGNIGIYQRDLHSFDEFPILQESAVPGQCMNCHTANRGSSEQFLIHLRGERGGTVIQTDGKQTWLNTKTDSTKANFGYSYWHPSGHYLTSSVNSIHQSFFVGKDKRIEVYDTMSDVLVMDVRTHELLLCPLLQTVDWETYPVFSADGKTLYFCTSKPCRMPAEYEKAKYSLCRIAFDAQTGTFGTEVDTLLSAATLGQSFTYPRPSYDGRWLMYSVTNFGNFPVNHTEADLWLMDLQTGKTRSLSEVNSPDVDSFHNWSTDSHWFVFSSRRGDGMYNQAFIASIDDKGNATKPFLLPQRNPKKFYHEMLDSYNCPDFTTEKVRFDARTAGRNCLDNQRIQVTLK